MAPTSCATTRLPECPRGRCTARSLIALADFGTEPELVEAGIANLRMLATCAQPGHPGRPREDGLADGLASLRLALAGRALGLDLAEERLLRIGLSLLESTPQYVAALPGGAHPNC